MENSANGWIRITALVSAIVALLGSIQTILRFRADLVSGQLSWSLG